MRRAIVINNIIVINGTQLKINIILILIVRYNIIIVFNDQMKNIEINMSTLSNAQKKMCVELIAHSNIKFQHKDNQYIAQIKVDPASNKQLPEKIVKNQQTKRDTNNTLNGGKKPLARVVKIGDLQKLESFHKNVQIYVYPKRMSNWNICQFIQLTYDKFWQENKKKSSQIRKINISEWFYQRMIASLRDKLKIQQLLVNFIDSMNHYMNKIPGLKIFYNFLSQKWPIDSLFYFLVLRGLLEQVIEEKILEKVSSTSGVLRLKNNPYERLISEQQVSNFLNILNSGGLSCSRSKSKPYEDIYRSLTQKMFYIEQKKKNFIPFFDLLQHMVQQFMDADASSCNMSLSKTQYQDNNSITQLITEDENQYNSARFKKNTNHSKSIPPTNYEIELEPAEEEKISMRIRQQKQSDTREIIRNAVFTKLNQFYRNLNAKPTPKILQTIQILLQTITQLDKNIWIRYRGHVSESQLFSIEKLQALFLQIKGTGVLSNNLTKNILLVPIIRQLIIKDINF